MAGCGKAKNEYSVAIKMNKSGLHVLTVINFENCNVKL